MKTKKTITPKMGSWMLGVLFTAVIALIGYLLINLPGFQQLGPLATAIVIAVIYRHFWGYPEIIRAGINFSAKKLLRFAIILYGLKLNMNTILNEGLTMLLFGVAVIVFSIVILVWVSRKLGASSSTIPLLLGVGTGVCGAAAIVAVAPLVKSSDEDTAISVGMIALIGTIFAVSYTLLQPFLPLTDVQYGIWSGISLHEIAQVVLAGEVAGEDGLAIALLAKLSRVFLLIPLVFVIIFWLKRKNQNETKTTIQYPWFLLGFIAMSLLGTYVFGHHVIISDSWNQAIATGTTFILTMAMVGLGLNVDLRYLKTKAVRPLVAITVTSILLSVVTFAVVKVLF